MRRCYRQCLIVLSILLVAATLAVLAVNLHLQSPATQQRLRQAAMETIGLPLTVRSSIYTPWDGVRLRGLVVPDVENEGVNFLEASEFQIDFRLLPLLRKEFVVRRLALKEAVLTWRQNEDGRWRVPRDPRAAVAKPSGTPILPAPAATPPTAFASAAIDLAPFGVRVENVEIRNSRILFENRDRWPLLDAEGITTRATVGEGGAASGRASVPEAVLAGLVVMRDLRADFHLDRGRLDVTDVSGQVAGGVMSGNGAIEVGAEGSPYQWRLGLDGLDLAQLKLSPKLAGTSIEGKLSAHFDFQGRNAPNRQARGGGRAEVRGGRLVFSSYIQDLGKALDIRELRNTDLREAYAELRLEDDLVRVDPLWIRGEEIAIEMRGTVARGGRLDLAARLLLAPGIAKSLSARTRRELPSADLPDLPGFRAVPFKVGGTLQDPQSDLAERLLGGGIGGQIGAFFLNLIGTP